MGARGIAAQAVGFVAMALLVSSFQMKTRRGILKVQLVSECFWVLHYFLLGAYTGMALNVVAAARCYVYGQRETKKWADKNFVPVVFFIFAVFTCAFTWSGPVSLLPTASICLNSFVLWSKKPRFIRFFSAPGCACWLVFNYLSGSYAGVLTEILDLVSIAAAILRYDVLKRGKKAGELDASLPSRIETQ
jgi:hypothetical protein